MKTTEKKQAEISKVEVSQNLQTENKLIVLPKKKLTATEKIELVTQFEAVQSKYEYLQECKENIHKFEKAQNGFSGAKLILKEGYNCEVTVSNPIIIEEMVKIAKLRLAEQLIKVEKEIEDFEI